MSWYNTDWKFRKKITIKQSYINNSISNFTLSIKLRKEYDLLNYSKPDLSDLIVVDSLGNQLPSYIDYVDKKGNFNIKCKIDLNNSSNELYLYYGNNTFTYEQDSQNTYGVYEFVSKMDMSYNDLSPSLLKTNASNTSLVRKGENYNKINELGFNPNNPIEYGTYLNDDYDQYYTASPISLNNSDNLSFSLWFNSAEETTGYDDIFGQDYDFYIGKNKYQKLYVKISTDLNSSEKISNTVISKNRWYHVAVTWNATTEILKIFIDGILDSTHIVRGNYIKDNNSNKINIGNWSSGVRYIFKGKLSDIRISENLDVTDDYISAQYNNDKHLDFISISNQEINPSLISEETGWRLEHSDYNKRIKFDIKGSEIIGNDEFRRFPFLLNLYDKCLNEAAQYGNDILITDEYGERLPFERFLYRQHINQTRYAGAYKIILNGNAKLTYDTNAEGGYRCSYLDEDEDYITFSEVRIVELGLHNLKIRYSNGDDTSLTNIYVNDDLYTVTLPPTGSWSSYQEIEVPVNWTQEWNEISFGKFSSSCDIDWLEPQDQDMTQLKGFVLLPKLKHNKSTSLYVYYDNDTAPIRFNPAYGHSTERINAEDLTYINASVVNNSKFKSGKCIEANSGKTGEITTFWNKSNGFYDITTEILAGDDAQFLYEIYINGINVSQFNTHLVSANMKMYNTTNRIYIESGNEIKIKTTGKISELRFDYSLFDTNVDWNSEEVWSDYEGVWHLSGTPDDGAPMLDYSGNNRHVNAYNMDAGTNSVNNSIGAGVLFYDNKDVLYGQFEEMNLDQDDLTISLWSQNYDSIDKTKGLLVSDKINLKIENENKLNFTMSNNLKSPAIEEIDNTERFSYIGITRNNDTNIRNISVNGETKKESQLKIPLSGNNDSITFGRHHKEADLTKTNYNTFVGVIAEVRIKKAVLSENWQANEYKNIKDAQQYIDYSSLECDSLERHYVISDNGGEINTNIISNSTIVIERDNNAIVDTNIKSNSSINFERDMNGSIRITSEDIEREFIIFTKESVKFLYSNKTAYVIPYTIEFIRFFTGGITSGKEVGDQSSIYIPDSVGSLSFGNAVASHEIADGYTVDVYFNDAVGGKTLSGGTITTFNIGNYINVVSGGNAISAGTDMELRESHYIDINALGKIIISDNKVSIEHTVLYNDPTDNSSIITNIEFNRICKYNDSNYIQYIKSLGTPSLYNEFITETEVSGIFFSNGSAVKVVIYKTICDIAIAKTNKRFQKLDVEEYIIYDDSNYIQYINIRPFDLTPDLNIYLEQETLAKVNINSEVVVDKIDAILAPSGKLKTDTENIYFDETNFNFISKNGTININKTVASVSFITDNYKDIIDTDAFKGSVNTSGKSVLDDVDIFINSEIAIISYGNLDSSHNIEYNIIDAFGGTAVVQADANLHQGVLYNPLRALYFYSCDYAKLNTKIFNEVLIDFNVLPNGKELLTAGLAKSNIKVNEIGYGSILINGKAEVAAIYNNESVETLVKTVILSQSTESNYNNESSGGLFITSESKRITEFVYVPEVYNFKTLILSEFKIDINFIDALIVLTNEPNIEREQLTKYYPNVYGGANLKGTATLVYDSTLIKVGSQLVGNVATLDDVPVNAEQGDIYYVIDNPISKYWEKKGANLVPIANPLNNNTGISGFANSKDELPSFGSFDGEIYLVGSPQEPEYYIWDNSYGDNGLWILAPEYQPNNTGVQGVLNSTDELPSLGNDGDTWLIGSSNDGVYYLWDSNSENWIIDSEIQPQMKVELESILVIKTSGSVILNEVVYSTDEEVSGEIKWIDKFETILDLNSDIDSASISTSGNYELLIVNSVSTQKINIISLSNKETIPAINRVNSNCVEVVTKILNNNKVEYYYAPESIRIIFSGRCEYDLVYTPRVIKNKIKIYNSYDIISKENIFAFISQIDLLFDMKFDIDTIIYNSSNDYIKLTTNTLELDNVLDINETNDFAKASIIEQMITIPLPIFNGKCVGGIKILDNESSQINKFIVDTTQVVNTGGTALTENLYNITNITGKSIKWRKKVTAGFMYIGDILEAIYIPSGTIKMSQRYFEIKVDYNYSNSSKISILGTVLASRKYIAYLEVNAKRLSGSVDRKSFYKNNNAEGIIDIKPYNKVVSKYNTSGSLLYIKTGNKADYKPVYMNKNVIKLSFSRNTIVSTVLYNNDITTKAIKVSLNSIRNVFRKVQIEEISVKLFQELEENITYSPILSYPIFVVSKGENYKAEVVVDKRIVAAKIKTTGVAISFAEYKRLSDLILTEVNINNVNKIIYSPDCSFAKLRTRIGILKDTEHGFCIYRDFNGNVSIKGILDPSLCYQSYNTVCKGGINALGGNSYEEENIYNYNDFSYSDNILISSDKTEYLSIKNYVYEVVPKGIKMTGNFTDPLEFFITQFGIVNMFGTANSSMRYDSEVNVGTLSIKINDDTTEYYEQNNYKYFSDNGVIELKNNNIEFDFIPSYKYKASGKLSISYNVDTELVYNYLYEMYGKALITGTYNIEAVKKFLSETSGRINLELEKRVYELAYTPSVICNVAIKGNISYEDIIINYNPKNGGVTWGKGTSADITDRNDYINISSTGYVDISGIISTIRTSKYFYIGTSNHLGSIKVSGNAEKNPEFEAKTEISSIITKILNYNTLGNTYKKCYGKVKINISSENIQAGFNYNSKIINISVGGESICISEYKYDVSIKNINFTGNAIGKIDTLYLSSGSIFVNGIIDGNLTIKPLVSGWLMFHGEIDNSIINYGELDSSIAKIKLNSYTLYRTNLGNNLEFNEITHRREYEAGLTNAEVDTPDEVWSSKQNFNDLIEE